MADKDASGISLRELDPRDRYKLLCGVIVPGLAGLNVTCMLQLPPAGIEPAQSSVSVKALLLLVMVEMVAANVPRFLSTTVNGALATVIV